MADEISTGNDSPAPIQTSGTTNDVIMGVGGRTETMTFSNSPDRPAVVQMIMTVAEVVTPQPAKPSEPAK